MAAVEEQVPEFDPSARKKKRVTKKKVEEITEDVENLEVSDKKDEQGSARAEERGGEPEGLDLKGKKKKKSSKKREEVVEVAEEEEKDDDKEDKEDDGEEGDGEEVLNSEVSFVDEDGHEVLPWAGTDRDYTYEELAGRIYSILHSHNPDLGSKQKRYVMKPPQVYRDGTKKTVWVNFATICGSLKRKPDHVLNYVLAELGSNGSVDGNHRLVIKGRFQPKQIENVIRHYIGEYVACRTCKSPDTTLKKENRLYFLCCDSCGSTRSVVAIKKGFEAQIGKRKKDKQ